MDVVLEQNFIKDHGYDSVSKAKAAGWSSVKPSNLTEKNSEGKFIWDVIKVGSYSLYRMAGISSAIDPTKTGSTLTTTGTTTGSTTTTTGGSTPTPKKKTSPYKRCENKALQTKYCVSELIKKVQICLKDAGHNLGTSGPQRDGVDGYWGDLTDAALRTYGFGSGIDKQAVEVICSTVDRIKRERVQKQLKDKADQEYQQRYGGMERASEVDYLYFGGENAGGGDEEASGDGMEGETLFFN
jgi:hypothetical protein